MTIFYIDTYPINQFKLSWGGGDSIFLNDISHPNFDLQISNVEPGSEFKVFYTGEQFSNYRRKRKYVHSNRHNIMKLPAT